MAKTTRELIHMLADRIGNENGERLRSALNKKAPFDDLLDRPMTDEEFTAQWQKMAAAVPRPASRPRKFAPPGSWGLPN